MILEDIYRDVVSFFKGRAFEQSDVFSKDIINAINDAIVQERIREVTNGVKSPYIISKSIKFSIEDRNILYLNKTTLDAPPLQELPLSQTFVTAVSLRSSNRIQSGSFTKDQKAIKGKNLYVAVNDISEGDFSARTFQLSEVVPYVVGKQYEVGDILFRNQTQKYFYVTGGFVAANEVENEPLEEVYWRKQGVAYTDVPVVSYEGKGSLRVLDSAITVNEKELYTTPNIRSLYVEYVPAWERVEELEAEIELPDSVITRVKREVYQLLLPKLKVGAGIKNVGDNNE